MAASTGGRKLGMHWSVELTVGEVSQEGERKLSHCNAARCVLLCALQKKEKKGASEENADFM